MTDRELLQRALDALISVWNSDRTTRQVETILAIKARLAQPEPEPVAWWHDRGDVVDLNVSGNGIPLYTAPPKKEWVGLTHEEHMEIMTGTMTTSSRMAAVEAKLKEKNSGN